MSLPKSPPPTPFPPLTAQDKTRFHTIFIKSNPVDSLLSGSCFFLSLYARHLLFLLELGEKARDIFLKSKLLNEQLMKIWCAVKLVLIFRFKLNVEFRNLADTQDRGALDSTEFAIGMYFIQGVMNNKISSIPTSLPPGLYHQAGGGKEPFGPVKSHISGNSGSFNPVVRSFQQDTGEIQLLQPDITGPSSQLKVPIVSARSFTHSNGYSPAWDVSPAEKASSDRHFDTLDSQKRGYIEGDVAVPFMLDSTLPAEVLAEIW
jgi:epidermal growth factor receptor substrate 15